MNARIFCTACLLIGVAVVLSTLSVDAANWDGGGDGVNWESGNNWNPNGVPSGVQALINGATVTLSSSPSSIADLRLADNGSTTVLSISNATLNATQLMFGHSGGNVTLNLTNSVLNNTGDAYLVFSTGTSQIVMNSGTINHNTNAGFQNRNGSGGQSEIRGTGAINITGTTGIRQNGRLVANGGTLTVTITGGGTVQSDNFPVNMGSLGQAGLYAVNQGKLVLPNLTFSGTNNDKTWGEDVGDALPDQVNSVRFDIDSTSSVTGTLSGSLLASNHGSVYPGLVNPIGIWEFTGLAFDSGETLRLLVRYDDALATSLSLTQSSLKLFQNSGSGWTDITDVVNDGAGVKTILSDPIGSMSLFAVAENAVNAVVPEPSTYALGLIGLAGLGLLILRGKRRDAAGS